MHYDVYVILSWITALYPELNLEELSIRAEYIISGKVTDVKNTELREIQTYEDIEMTVPTEVIEYPVTPVTVAVEEAIKGDVENVFTFYQDGGITDTYIQLPDGEKLETGDEVIIFASESKEGWGQRSVFCSGKLEPSRGESSAAGRAGCGRWRTAQWRRRQ